MPEQFDVLRKIRTHLLEFTNVFTPKQLNYVPENFNNNIIWNLAHMTAAQQGVCYKRSGLDVRVGEDFYTSYTAGTKPQKELSEAEIQNIKQLLFTSVDQLQEDYQNNIFKHYNSWTTRYGVTLNNIEDVIQFLIFHDGLHIGYIMALKHLVKK